PRRRRRAGSRTARPPPPRRDAPPPPRCGPRARPGTPPAPPAPSRAAGEQGPDPHDLPILDEDPRDPPAHAGEHLVGDGPGRCGDLLDGHLLSPDLHFVADLDGEGAGVDHALVHRDPADDPGSAAVQEDLARLAE